MSCSIKSKRKWRPNLRAIAAILAKDFEDAVRNQTLVLILVGPVLLSVLFNRAFSDRDLRLPEVALHGPESGGFVRILKTTELVKIRLVASLAEGRELVRAGQVPVAISVGESFDEELLADAFPRLELVVDESAHTDVALVRQALRSALREQAGQEIPADIRVEKIGENPKPKAALLPLWVVFTALSGLMVTSSSLIEEKDSGTLAQVLTAPVSMVEVVVGKVGVGFALASLAAFLVLILNGVPLGPRLLSLTCAGCLAFASLGVLVGVSSAGQTAANAATSALFLVLFIPVALANFSKTMDQVAAFSPAFYLHRGVADGVAGQAGSWLLDLTVLLAVFIIVCLLGSFLLRRETR